LPLPKYRVRRAYPAGVTARDLTSVDLGTDTVTVAATQEAASIPRARGKRSDLPTSSQPKAKSFHEQIAEHGISKGQAERWQRLADIPDEGFAAALAGPKKPTTNGIIQAAFPPKPKPVSPEALWLWGRLRDFQRDGMLDKDPVDVLSTMTPQMLDDVRELTPKVLDWLRATGEAAWES
jgi:hypothetical protein